MSLREPIKVVADILQSELVLSGDRVMLAYQKNFIPIDGLYLSLSYLGPSRVVNTSDQVIDDGKGGLTEVQSVTLFQIIQIEALSFDDSARLRKDEIAMAIRSIFSQQQQEANNLQLARNVMPMLDTSYLEETKFVNRFTTTVACTSLSTKSKSVNSFTSFETKVFADAAQPYTDFDASRPPSHNTP